MPPVAKKAFGTAYGWLVHELEGAMERLKAQDEAGVDVHQVEIDASSPAEFERIVARLL
jgi:hypothetical protein